ncbi:MAG: hypothetical protein ACMUIU_03585 [bacterium]
MSKKNELHFGNIGGNLNVGGDIVAGDKITTIDSSTTNINYGFKRKEDKEEFVYQIDELYSIMNQIRSQIDKIEGFDKDKKEKIIQEITEHAKFLKTAKEKADSLTIGQEAPQEKTKTIEECLNRSGTLMEKIQKMGAKIASFANKIEPIMSKALPILINIRKLFGLP